MRLAFIFLDRPCIAAFATTQRLLVWVAGVDQSLVRNLHFEHTRLFAGQSPLPEIATWLSIVMSMRWSQRRWPVVVRHHDRDAQIWRVVPSGVQPASARSEDALNPYCASEPLGDPCGHSFGDRLPGVAEGVFGCSWQFMARRPIRVQPGMRSCRRSSHKAVLSSWVTTVTAYGDYHLRGHLLEVVWTRFSPQGEVCPFEKATNRSLGQECN